MKVLKFYAEWCAPCKMMTRIIEDAKDKITTKIEEVNIDDNVFLSTHFGIRSVPTMVMVDDNEKEIKRLIGFHKEEDLLKWLSE
jgi:thioredoxin 1